MNPYRLAAGLIAGVCFALGLSVLRRALSPDPSPPKPVEPAADPAPVETASAEGSAP